jgi:hypothetical protein
MSNHGEDWFWVYAGFVALLLCFIGIGTIIGANLDTDRRTEVQERQNELLESILAGTSISPDEGVNEQPSTILEGTEEYTPDPNIWVKFEDIEQCDSTSYPYCSDEDEKVVNLQTEITNLKTTHQDELLRLDEIYDCNLL